jgi:hypothetical protein
MCVFGGLFTFSHRQLSRTASHFFRLQRPHLEQFLAWAFQHFAGVALWTKASAEWARVALSTPPLASYAPKFVFVWTGSRCAPLAVDCGLVVAWTKPLRKVWRRQDFKAQGWARSNTLIVDDTPSNYAHNYGNGVPMPPFDAGAPPGPEDRWLLELRTYLLSLACCDDVRRVEKRTWTRQAALEMR